MNAPLLGLTGLPLDRPAPRADGASLILAIAVTLAVLGLNIGPLAVVDPDDSLRLVEVRNWLAGQGWFDLNMARLDPPLGSILHWSRLVDLPTGLLIKFFGLFVATPTAELWAMIAVPTLWLFAWAFGIQRLAALLCGLPGRLPAALGTFLCGVTLVQFVPGRIGHHAPESTALVWTVACALAALDVRRTGQAVVAGLLVALSLAMSLETLPFHALILAALTGLWIHRGAAYARLVLRLGLGLVIGLPLAFLATVGPARYFLPVCDAYGAAHLGAGLIGGSGLIVLALATPRLSTRVARLAAAAGVAAIALAYLALVYPACLHSPFAAVDPLVRKLWLSHVAESFTWPVFFAGRPMLAVALLAPLLLGGGGALWAARMSTAQSAERFAVIAVLAIGGGALAFWQIRVIGSAAPFALMGGIFVALRLADKATRAQPVFAAFALLPFTSTAWALALPSDHEDSKAALGKAACLAPGAFTPLQGLAPGTAIAPMDSGAHLLRYTRLDVFAGPYHRNNDGNRFMLDVYAARPDAAHRLLSQRHVTYVLTCPDMADLAHIIDDAPDGLAAHLARGDVPAYLTPLPLAGTVYRAYLVR